MSELIEVLEELISVQLDMYELLKVLVITLIAFFEGLLG